MMSIPFLVGECRHQLHYFHDTTQLMGKEDFDWQTLWNALMILKDRHQLEHCDSIV